MRLYLTILFTLAMILPLFAREQPVVHVIEPYKVRDLWVFDAPTLGLEAEPFVWGASEVLDTLTADIEDASKGFRLSFSATHFDGATHTFIWERAERGGNWYYCRELEQRGWLCPALFKYFSRTPKHLYVRASPSAQ